MATYTNKRGLPEPIRWAVENSDYGHNGDISVTSLIDSVRVRQLTKQHDHEIEIDVADCTAQLIGSGVHYVLEKVASAHPGEYEAERRLYAEVLGWQITGQIDLYHLPTKTVSDYKITSVWSVLDGPKREWINQLNCYAWLERMNGREVEALEIVALLKGWDRRKAQQDITYPQHDMVVLPVPLWTAGEASQYVMGRVAAHQLADIPGATLEVCTPEERWERPAKFAAKKKGAKRATRLFDAQGEAESYAEYHGLEVEHRPGENVRCETYCDVRQWCDFGSNL